MDLTPRHAAVVSYHLFAYQQSAPAISARNNPWKKVGDVKALPLPMACTLTQVLLPRGGVMVDVVLECFGLCGLVCFSFVTFEDGG